MTTRPEITDHELVVFAFREQATHAGFRNSTRTIQHGGTLLRAWWPDLGLDQLRGYDFSRVTFCCDSRYVSRDMLGHLRAITCRRDGVLWLEG